MVLIGLDVVEVVTFTTVKAVVAVKLEETFNNRVDGSINEDTVVVPLVDGSIIRFATSIAEKISADGKITDGEVG